MSKNLTRKGLAFGALVALSASVFAGAPAIAAGEDGRVTLAPNAGTEYNVLAGNTFDLKSNYSADLKSSSASLKFLVTDPSAKSKVDIDSNGSTNDVAYTQVVGLNWAVTSNVATITTAAAHGLQIGDIVAIAGLGDIADGNFTITDTPTTSSFKFAVTHANAVAADDNNATLDLAVTAQGINTAAVINARGFGSKQIVGSGALVNARSATDNSYVVSTGVVNDITKDAVLRLINTDVTASLSLTVTAWVDDNSNNLIDGSESKSPVRTVQFLTADAITTTSTLRPVSVGDATVKADITTSPVLNGQQVVASVGSEATTLSVVFTRPGAPNSIESTATTGVWSDTTKKWTVESANMNANNVAAVVIATGAAAAGTPGWGITQATAQAANNATKIKIVKNIVTFTTTADHGLQVGDRVVIANSTANTRVNSATTPAGSAFSTVLSVPSTTTFTYKEVGTSTTDVAEVADTAVTMAITGGETKILRNYAVAGTYTAQAKFAKYSAVGTSALVASGSAGSSASAANAAAAVTLTGANNENVTYSSLVVRKGTLSADFSAAVEDADGKAVAAGLDAVITVGALGTGTYKVNGATVAAGDIVYAKTDAAGTVPVKVENTLGLADASIVLTVKVQTATTGAQTINWDPAQYTITDLNDPLAAGVANRAAVKGGTYSFNLLVQDQWKKPLTGDFRLKASATLRGLTEQFLTLTNGKATFTITDNGSTGTTSVVSVDVQQKVSGVWGTSYTAGDVYTEWSSAKTVTFYDQTDVLALNAAGANYPSTTAAIFAAATSTGAIKALDGRTAYGSAPVVVTAGKAVVSGAVTNSITGVAKTGAVVSLSGAGLLFKSGDVWSIGSANVLSNDGTFAVDVYSNNPGTKVVTVTSGSLTKTASLVFTGASSAVRTLTISGTQKVLPGSTLQAAILLVDGNGNAVDTTAPATTPASEYISVSYEGPGLLSGSALPTETDKDGKASVRYLLGTGDRGVATVTVKFDANYDGDFVDATDITVTRQYLIGVSAKITKAATSSAVVKNALGASIKVVRGSKVTTKVATSNSQKVTLKGGSGTVKVYVNGVKVASK